MSPKQHTFKTTKSTEWMDGILDQYTGFRDKSAFVRHLLEYALDAKGLKPDVNGLGRLVSTDQVTPLSDIRHTNVTQKSDKSHTPAQVQEPKEQVERAKLNMQSSTSSAPVFEEVEAEISVEALESQLDQLEF